jgi:hypothetical protein
VKILFLVIGPVSFKASNFVRSFIKQLDLDEHRLSIMAEELTFEYLQIYKKINYLPIDEKFNEAKFVKYLNNNEIDLIITVNLELILFDDSKLLFKRLFFRNIKEIPILFFSTANSFIFKDNVVSIQEKPLNKLKIQTSFAVIKSCPPYLPEDDDRTSKIKTFYWKNLEQFAFLNKDDSRTTLVGRLKSPENAKIVSLYIDFESIGYAYALNLVHHYTTLVECVYKYLSNLDIACHLVVVNLPHFTMPETYPKVKITFMGDVKDAEYEMIIRASDLVLTESIASIALIDAANLKIPAITLKNTLTLEKSKDKQLSVAHSFNNFTEFANKKVQELIKKCPDAIFKYYAFPNKASITFDAIKVFGLYIFTFAELFDEEVTTALFKELLSNPEAIKEEVYRIEQYLALRADALEASELIQALLGD